MTIETLTYKAGVNSILVYCKDCYKDRGVTGLTYVTTGYDGVAPLELDDYELTSLAAEEHDDKFDGRHQVQIIIYKRDWQIPAPIEIRNKCQDATH